MADPTGATATGAAATATGTGSTAVTTAPRRRAEPPAPLGRAALALVGAALLAVLVPLLATLEVQVPGRAVLAVAFFLLVPGVPLALALRLPSSLLTLALAVASSLAVWLLYGTLTIVGGWWEPVVGAWSVTLLALLLSLVVVLRRRSVPAPGSSATAPGAPAAGARTPVGAGLLLGVLLVLTGVVWWWSTQYLRLDDASVLGLLPVVGWRYVVALAMISALTAYALLRRRLDHVLLTGCALLVALMGYATVPVGDGEGSVPVGWVHVAFAQYITDHGTVPLGVDARFSWPGFFSAAAQLTALAGTADARSFLELASVVSTMAAVPALLLIAHAVTRSWRWSWVALFVYLVTNWYQQDYFSPQATAFVITTTVLATLLWLRSGAGDVPLQGSWPSRARQAFLRVPALPAGVAPRTAAAVLLVLAMLVLAVVVGHQLTPLALIFALVVFTVTGQTRFRLLWLFTAVVFATWFSYGATDYWFGHLKAVFGDLGQVSNSVGAGVSGRLVGDPTYRAAQFVRIGSSLLVFGGACLGLLLLRRRADVLLLAGLAAAPFGLLALQSYGGEGVIRAFLYASPLLAPLSAVALRAVARRVLALGAPSRPRPQPGRRPGVVVATFSALVLAGLVLTFTRGLNVSFERTPPDQATASDTLRHLVRPGDKVAVPTSIGLTPALDPTSRPLVYLDLEACDAGDINACLRNDRPRFVVLTLTQGRYGQLAASRSPDWVWQLGDRLVSSAGYRRIYTGPDAWLLEADPGEGS